VGPEQNLTYIALTAPQLAFVVDIRRDNALLHLLYRALFERAGSRAEFVALLLGRPYVAAGDPEAAGAVRRCWHTPRSKRRSTHQAPSTALPGRS
jgi:hypothetical protein